MARDDATVLTGTLPSVPLASLSDDFSTFSDAVSSFFESLASVQIVPLLIGLTCFGIYLTFRARAFFNVLRAAYPTERIEFRRIWGAYVAAYGFNNVVPARGGDVIKLFLAKTSVPRSSYPAVGAAFFVEGVFDATMGVFILTYAFTQGVFPKPPDFAALGAFDLSFFAGHPRFTLFFLTALGVLALVLFAVLSRRVQAFWLRVRQGLTILFDRRRYIREVWLVQFAGWCFRFTAFWFLLEAFNIGGSVGNVLLVLGVNAVAAVVPFTPGGAGVQQAFLVKVFGAGAVAYSVGQQIAIATFSLTLGFVALVTIFKFRSFKEVIAAGRDARAQSAEEHAAESQGGVAVAVRVEPDTAPTVVREAPPPARSSAAERERRRAEREQRRAARRARRDER